MKERESLGVELRTKTSGSSAGGEIPNKPGAGVDAARTTVSGDTPLSTIVESPIGSSRQQCNDASNRIAENGNSRNDHNKQGVH